MTDKIAVEASQYSIGPRTRPPWAVRYGVWCMLTFVGALFAASAVIPYRPIVTAPARVEAQRALRAPQPGRVRLAVADGARVCEGEPVAYFESGAGVGPFLWVPREVAANVRVPQSATLSRGAVHVAVTITAVLPAAGDMVPLRILGTAGPPPDGDVTLSMTPAGDPLLGQLLRSMKR